MRMWAFFVSITYPHRRDRQSNRFDSLPLLLILSALSVGSIIFLFFFSPFSACLNKGLIVVVFTISTQVIICGFFNALNCVVPTHKYKSCNMNDTFMLPHLLSISKDQDFFFSSPGPSLSLSKSLFLFLFRFRFLGLPKRYCTWVRLSDLYKEFSKHTNHGRLFAP